ncbi:deoxyribose-phosphate aldolase [Candidatus Woesearchaeota archaeon]|nr:deoxyribose-phosphate aldolase [Candidatus Woesearchaeota archaeon]
MEITKEYLAKMIDHTLLKPNASTKDLELLCEQAVLYSFGAVCVRPFDVRYAYKLLKGTGVKVCTVVGFPWGIQTTEAKVRETCEAIYEGATEIDMVINRGRLKEKYYPLFKQDINDVVLNAKTSTYAKDKIIVKTILETCELKDDEIVQACLLAKEAGADFVKTSTGLYKGAKVKDVRLMHKTVPDLGVKASGGIKDWKKAERLIKAGATRLGTSSGVNILSEYMKLAEPKREYHPNPVEPAKTDKY